MIIFINKIDINVGENKYLINGQQANNIYNLDISFAGGERPKINLTAILEKNSDAIFVISGYVYPNKPHQIVCCGDRLGVFLGKYNVLCPTCGKHYESEKSFIRE